MKTISYKPTESSHGLTAPFPIVWNRIIINFINTNISIAGLGISLPAGNKVLSQTENPTWGAYMRQQFIGNFLSREKEIPKTRFPVTGSPSGETMARWLRQTEGY